jgi:Sulfotransferase family
MKGQAFRRQWRVFTVWTGIAAMISSAVTWRRAIPGMKVDVESSLFVVNTTVVTRHDITSENDERGEIAIVPYPSYTVGNSSSLSSALTQTMEDLRPRRILFVHVGKAGGETIKRILDIGCASRKNPNRRQRCRQELAAARQSSSSGSALSKSVTAYLHCDSFFPSQAHIDDNSLINSLLFNLRHPVDRLVSWYRYVHPRTCRDQNVSKSYSVSCLTRDALAQDPLRQSWEYKFFEQCFPTINEWAIALSAPPSTAVEPDHGQPPTNCHQLAWDTALGKIQLETSSLAAHTRFNLRYYVAQTLGRKEDDHREILVVRTAHLWQDLLQLEHFLRHGDNEAAVQPWSEEQPFGSFFGMNETHTASTNDRNPDQGSLFQLSPDHVRVMCCALQSELRLYRELLDRAANLSPTARSGTWQQSLHYCLSSYSSWQDLQSDCANTYNASRRSVTSINGPSNKFIL